MTDLLVLVLGIGGLFIGGEWLVRGSSRLATSFGVPVLVIGLTVVALGTSAPEMLVGANAALRGESQIALGNVIGSNIANIGLILALTSLIVPVAVSRILVRREIPLMIGFSVAAMLLALDGEIGRVDGILLLLAYGLFTAMVYRLTPQEQKEVTAEVAADVEVIEGCKPHEINRRRETLRLLAGLALLAVGAQFTVTSAVNIARSFGISELLIGLTVVAVGTSLPELVASVMAAIRKESDIAAGNVIGSNISNILVILGVTALVNPIPVSQEFIAFDMVIMTGFAVLLLPMVLRGTFGRIPAGITLAVYAAYTVMVLVLRPAAF